MASSRILSAIEKATRNAVKNVTFGKSQSIMRQVCNIGAEAAGIPTTQVHNGDYEGKKASFFTVANNETHIFAKNSALLEYVIVSTDPQGKKHCETIYCVPMPIPVEDGGEASGSSSNK